MVDEIKSQESENIINNTENIDNEINTQTDQADNSAELSNLEKQQSHDLFADFMEFLSNRGITPENEEKTRITIPTGIDLLDTILGGGVGTKLVQFVGMPGCGKSALVAKVLASGQRKWPGKFLCVYLDSEQSMSTERLMALGVTNPPIKPIVDSITVEKVFEVIEAICVYKEQHPELMDIPSCVVWDSVANTLTDKGMAADKPTEVLGQKANILSHLLPRYVGQLNKYNICLLCVNQLREKIELNPMMSSPPTLRFLVDKNIPGGNSLLYNSFQIFFFRQKNVFSKNNSPYGFEGVSVLGKTLKNKLFAPNIEIEMIFSFDRGFSNFWTNYELLKTYKRISIGGGWVSLPGYSGAKCQVKDLPKKYKSDKEFAKIWDETVREVLNTEFIEKYKSQSVSSDIILD